MKAALILLGGVIAVTGCQKKPIAICTSGQREGLLDQRQFQALIFQGGTAFIWLSGCSGPYQAHSASGHDFQALVHAAEVQKNGIAISGILRGSLVELDTSRREVIKIDTIVSYSELDLAARDRLDDRLRNGDR
jgi:hypothetical protein